MEIIEQFEGWMIRSLISGSEIAFLKKSDGWTDLLISQLARIIGSK